MRINLIPVLTASKAVSKARVTGKLSLVTVAKLNILNYYLKFAQKQIDNGVEGYTSKYTELKKKFNNLVFNCPNSVCDIDGDSYAFIGTITNPYNPTLPTTSNPDPDPTPSTNEPATIGDHSMTVEDGTSTTLTIDMFLETYSDPEGDLIDAVRIDDIHTTNVGTFYFNDTPITKGLIMLREDIEAGKLTHVATSSEAITTDSFEFSVRDEGSGIWVN